MTYRRRLRAFVRRLGYDVAPWPNESLEHFATKLIVANEIDLVLDIGANDGGYGRGLRTHGYSGEIISFEPIASARARLARQTDERWQVIPFALGETQSIEMMNVAGNNQASSSLLQMTDLHRVVAPAANYIGSERVEVRTLDSFFASRIASANKVFIKIDVQGFEMRVLRGGSQTLRHALGVRVELSLRDVYRGATRWRDMVDYLEKRGFQLVRLDPGFTDGSTGEMLQVDGSFLRRGERD